MTGEPPAHPVTRRALAGLAVATAGVALAGCDADLPGRAAPKAPGPGAPGTSRSDLSLLGAALAGERRILAALERTSARHPGLRLPLAAAVAAHTAHVSLLAGAAAETTEETAPSPGPSPEDGGPVPGRPRAAVRLLADEEAALAATQAGLAVQADSGPFARVLASFAASAAQQEQALRALRVAGRAPS